MCTYVPGACGGQKNELELELKVVVSHHVSAWNQPKSSARTARSLNC